MIWTNIIVDFTHLIYFIQHIMCTVHISRVVKIC